MGRMETKYALMKAWNADQCTGQRPELAPGATWEITTARLASLGAVSRGPGGPGQLQWTDALGRTVDAVFHRASGVSPSRWLCSTRAGESLAPDRALERWRVLDDAIEIARGLCDSPDDADAQGEIEGLQRARGEVEGAGLSADGRVAVRRVLARALGGLAAGQAGVYFSRAHDAGATGHEEWEDEYRRRHREWTRVANAVRGIR